MYVVGVGEVSLYDWGGIPVVWEDGTGVRQAPGWGGNVYQPGDLFWDNPGRQGTAYRLGADYALRPDGTPAPAPSAPSPPAPSTPAPAPPQVIVVRPQAPASTPATPRGAAPNPAQQSVQNVSAAAGGLFSELGENKKVFGITLPMVAWIAVAMGVAQLSVKRRR